MTGKEVCVKAFRELKKDHPLFKHAEYKWDDYDEVMEVVVPRRDVEDFFDEEILVDREWDDAFLEVFMGFDPFDDEDCTVDEDFIIGSNGDLTYFIHPSLEYTSEEALGRDDRY